MRQVRVCGSAVEGKLQNLHAWKRETITQRFDVVSNDSQIFCHERQASTTQQPVEGLQQPITRRLDPTPLNGRVGIGGNLPVSLEAAKMIDSNPVVQFELTTQTPYPPGKSVRLHRSPVVMGITPALPRRGKVVGWDAGHDAWISERVEVEVASGAPHIGAIGSDENRHVAEQNDPPRARVVFEFLPLREKQILLERVSGSDVCEPPAGSLKCRRPPISQRDRPFLPGIVPTFLPYRHVEGVVGKPPIMLTNKALIGAARRLELSVSHLKCVERGTPPLAGPGTQKRLAEPAALDQPFRINQRRVSGMDRKALVRGAVGVRRIDRQGLPNREPRVAEEVDEPTRLLAESSAIPVPR